MLPASEYSAITAGLMEAQMSNDPGGNRGRRLRRSLGYPFPIDRRRPLAHGRPPTGAAERKGDDRWGRGGARR